MLKIISVAFFCFYISDSIAQIKVEEKIALLNNLGYNVTNYKINERTLAKARTYTSDPKDILILGSSRVRELNHSFFEKKEMINLGMSGAILQDLMAVYYNYEKNNTKPKVVYIGIDPWLLNNSDERWKVLKQDFSYMENILAQKPVNDSIPESFLDYKLRQLYPDSIFQYSQSNFTKIQEACSFLMSNLNIKKLPVDTLRFINKKIKDIKLYAFLSKNKDLELNGIGKMLVQETEKYRRHIELFLKKYQKINIKKLNVNILTSIYGFPELPLDDLIITKKKQNEQNTINYDGSLGYNKAFETYNKKTVKTSVENFKKKPYKLAKNQKINNKNKKLFELFIEYFIENNIAIKFILLPFNPDVYSFLSTNHSYSFINEFELYINDFAEDRNIEVFGSYNPNENNLEMKDFYDAMHLRISGLRKIMLLDEKPHSSKPR